MTPIIAIEEVIRIPILRPHLFDRYPPNGVAQTDPTLMIAALRASVAVVRLK